MYTIDILNKICRFVNESSDCEAIGTIVAFKNKPYKELLINFLNQVQIICSVQVLAKYK